MNMKKIDTLKGKDIFYLESIDEQVDLERSALIIGSSNTMKGSKLKEIVIWAFNGYVASVHASEEFYNIIKRENYHRRLNKRELIHPFTYNGDKLNRQNLLINLTNDEGASALIDNIVFLGIESPINEERINEYIRDARKIISDNEDNH